VEQEYRFHPDDGMKTPAELFDGRSQLLVLSEVPGFSAFVRADGDEKRVYECTVP
jgi:predicted dithiol-disulfide oxidoreductase (DUF899 family)